MAEINNNIPAFGYKNIEKIDNRNKAVESAPNEVQTEQAEPQYVFDTGVLGRSQIKSTKGADATQSIDEAVALAKYNPDILECADDIFDSTYELFLADGMEPADAYANAAMAQREFIEIAKARLN